MLGYIWPGSGPGLAQTRCTSTGASYSLNYPNVAIEAHHCFFHLYTNTADTFTHTHTHTQTEQDTDTDTHTHTHRHTHTYKPAGTYTQSHTRESPTEVAS